MNEVDVLYYEGLRLSRSIEYASATLLVYDHAINLADEIEHFWAGPWTYSRGLYFCMRYLGVMHVVILMLCNGTHIMSIVLCAYLVYGVGIVVMILYQAAITIRVWYMFTHRPMIRIIAVQAFAASTLVTALLIGFLWHLVRLGVPQADSEPPRTSLLAWIYVPSLFLHTLLFALKVYRFVASPKYLQRDTFLWRFLKEGMVMYACTLGSLLFLVVGLTMTKTSQIPVYEVAFTGGLIFIALTIVSVCRAMLSIKSLAATMHVDPGWLLNHAELKRVHWRPGATEGEIVVESFDLPLASRHDSCMPQSDEPDEPTLSTDTKDVLSSSPGISC